VRGFQYYEVLYGANEEVAAPESVCLYGVIELDEAAISAIAALPAEFPFRRHWHFNLFEIADN
jgi:hypothetical protein